LVPVTTVALVGNEGVHALLVFELNARGKDTIPVRFVPRTLATTVQETEAMLPGMVTNVAEALTVLVSVAGKAVAYATHAHPLAAFVNRAQVTVVALVVEVARVSWSRGNRTARRLTPNCYHLSSGQGSCSRIVPPVHHHGLQHGKIRGDPRTNPNSLLGVQRRRAERRLACLIRLSQETLLFPPGLAL